MTENFVTYRLFTDYSLNIGYNQWLINWLLIDYLLISHWFHWCHWCHWLVTSGWIYWALSLINAYLAFSLVFIFSMTTFLQLGVYIHTDKAICAWKVRTSDQNLMASCQQATSNKVWTAVQGLKDFWFSFKIRLTFHPANVTQQLFVSVF